MMYFVPCPRCGAAIGLPEDAVGPNRSDPWNVIGCDGCDLVFDFEDCEVQPRVD